ncbi:hypothetical protein ACWC1D_29845 [Streptomyces sp. NPDC001478]
MFAAARLILPALLGNAPAQVPRAACGLAALLVRAAATRPLRDERAPITCGVACPALAAFTARGRFGPAPFTG